jgi:4-hydroxyacetophenone monooxygenase
MAETVIGSDSPAGSPAVSQTLAEALAAGYAEAALRQANIPSLLAVLYQLTGDQSWLDDPYRPTRTRGLEDHDTGGLPDEIQSQVRAAALEALRRWADGKQPAVPAPVGDELVALMSHNVGESVPAEFEPMMAVELGFRATEPPQVSRRDAGFSALVIGAGVSGMAAALALREAGIPVTVLEKNDEVGGTWLENRYPGCGVDTPSYLYSFRRYQRRWSTYFGKRDEVEAYLAGFADHYELRRDIWFGCEAISARWDAETALWTVTVRSRRGDLRQLRANVVISAVGQLNRPKVPELPGIDSFAGPLFHSACWPAGLDITGRRVAVVGTGASAMQIVPAIADRVASLAVFQRSPQWIAPNDNYFRPVSDEVHWLLERVPFYAAWYRFRLAWNFNDKIHSTLVVDPDWPDAARSVSAANDGHRRHLTRYIRSELEGRDDLLDKCLPPYPPFGKRMLLDNGWYRALRRPNVELVTDAAEEITPRGVRTADGTVREADVIVFATGFDAQRLLHPLEVTGTSGTIREAWGDDDPRAYLGMTAPGFPNFFVMYGPNTNLGHGGSWITMAECQSQYLAELLVRMVDGKIASVDCRADVHDRYNDEVDAAHARMIWTHRGMRNWYRNASGRVVTNSPWRVADYYLRTQHPNLADFELAADERDVRIADDGA